MPDFYAANGWPNERTATTPQRITFHMQRCRAATVEKQKWSSMIFVRTDDVNLFLNYSILLFKQAQTTTLWLFFVRHHEITWH